MSEEKDFDLLGVDIEIIRDMQANMGNPKVELKDDGKTITIPPMSEEEYEERTREPK